MANLMVIPFWLQNLQNHLAPKLWTTPAKTTFKKSLASSPLSPSSHFLQLTPHSSLPLTVLSTLPPLLLFPPTSYTFSPWLTSLSSHFLLPPPSYLPITSCTCTPFFSFLPLPTLYSPLTYFPFLPLLLHFLPTSYLPITSYTLLPPELTPLFSPFLHFLPVFPSYHFLHFLPLLIFLSLPTRTPPLTNSLSSHFCYTSYPVFPFLPLPTCCCRGHIN